MSNLISSYSFFKLEAVMAAPIDRFTVTRYQLAELMSQRREDGVAMIREFGGTDGLGTQLETNLTEGLTNSHQDLESRRTVFGRNFIKPNPPKLFLALCLDAIQDKTLIILIAAAVVSLVLGLTVEEQKVREAAVIVWTICMCVIS